MEPSRLAIQLLVTVICAGLANVIIPRQVPGKFLGLFLTGLVGVWIGGATFTFLNVRYGLNYPFLHWAFEGVPIIPSILGSVLVIYLITNVWQRMRYTR
jgi:uncharacterized membrane protein YeaQ/YmgE (transglycosylase-associated protein family)